MEDHFTLADKNEQLRQRNNITSVSWRQRILRQLGRNSIGCGQRNSSSGPTTNGTSFKHSDTHRSSGHDDLAQPSNSIPLKHRISLRPCKIACANGELESHQMAATENLETLAPNVTNELGITCQTAKPSPRTSVIGALLCADSSDSDSIDDLQPGESKFFNFECCPPSECGDSIRENYISGSRYTQIELFEMHLKFD